MALTSNELGKVFRRVANRCIFIWEVDTPEDDLIQELWVWYLESPKIQQTLADLSERQRYKYITRGASQILSADALASGIFNGRVLYSADSIKEALEGRSTNRYLLEVLPLALDALQHRDDELTEAGRPREYAEALRARYTDESVPTEGAEKMRLSRAVKSLTDEINVTYLTSDNEGKPGSRSAVFPDTRRVKGSHSDPTPYTALSFMDSPELEDDYFEETDDMWKEAYVQLV